MHYYSFQVKMKDLRGGFSGLMSKSKSAVVDGVAYLLIKDETQFSQQRINSTVQMAGVEIVKPDVSRPFTPDEYESLPGKFKDMLQKNGVCLQTIPSFSAEIKPFSINS